MAWLFYVVVLYGLLVAGSGIEAFITKGSLASLIPAVTSGLIVLAGAAISKKKPTVGFGICAFVSLALAGFFVTRYMKSPTVWPALTMIVVSALVFLCLVAGHFLSKSKPVG